VVAGPRLRIFVLILLAAGVSPRLRPPELMPTTRHSVRAKFGLIQRGRAVAFGAYSIWAQNVCGVIMGFALTPAPTRADG